MTLQEHLEDIARSLAARGADETEILLFQLYLICVAKAGFLGQNAEQATSEPPFDRIDEVLRPIWPKVDMDSLEAFYDDGDLERLEADVLRSHFNEYLNKAARSGGDAFDHFQPRELSSLVSSLCGETVGKTIYNPYAGVGSYAAVFHAGNRFHGEEYDPRTWAIGVLKAWMEGFPSDNYICGDSLAPGWETPFDIIVSTPPIGRIPNSRETYCDRLVASAASSLTTDGVMVMVTTMSSLLGRKGADLLDTGMLDLVVTLPSRVFYWTGYAPVIIRLRQGRGKDEPVTLVDGSSSFSPGGRGTRIIKVPDLITAIEERAPSMVIALTPEEIRRNPYHLNPGLYLSKRDDRNEDGVRLVPLHELGSIPRLPLHDAASSIPERVITIADLATDPCLADIEPHPLDRDVKTFHVLDRSALLVFATRGSLRVGYAHASPEKPVWIQDRILAFIPDEERVSIRYLAHALPRADIRYQGGSAMMVTRDEILLTSIPLLTKKEQETLIDKDLAAFQQKAPEKPTAPKRKPATIIVGRKASIPTVFSEGLSIRRCFDFPSEAEEWIKGNKKRVDAVILLYMEGMGYLDVLILCKNNAPDLPVYFLTPEGRDLEAGFGNYAEKFLPGHCFDPGSEKELVEALSEEVSERNTTEWQIRRRYSRELAAADSIDGRFPEKGFCLRKELEDMLFSEDPRPDWRNQLRKIRDDCFLRTLVDFGFLPRTDGKALTMGGQLALLANRCFKPKEESFRFILVREVIPKDITEMLVASRQLLNEGSHSLRAAEWDLQMASLFIVMAALCHLADMMDDGRFDRYDPDRNRQIYISVIRDDAYETGVKTVRCLTDDPGYLYADNIHLDEKVCRRLRIKSGDLVDIHGAVMEGTPRVSDSTQILFYSKEFTKA